MKKDGKLIIGKPYEIMVKDDNRIINLKGSSLTPNDVKMFLENGFITKDDVEGFVIHEKQEFPSFDDVNKCVSKSNIIEDYPVAAVMLYLKEYSNRLMKNVTIKAGDIVYLISFIDFKPMSYKVNKWDDISHLAVFPSKDDADRALNDIINGFSNL